MHVQNPHLSQMGNRDHSNRHLNGMDQNYSVLPYQNNTRIQQ